MVWRVIIGICTGAFFFRDDHLYEPELKTKLAASTTHRMGVFEGGVVSHTPVLARTALASELG